MIDTCRGEIEWKWETDWDLSDRKMGTDGCRKMKEDDGVRTLECLRGRLLAERQASRVAKEAAELLSNKVTELEKHLKKEARLRDKAEKRLKLLMKKIESLKLSPVLEESEHLTSSDYSASSSSCGSTTTTNLAQPDPEESESKPQQTDKPSSIHQESKIKDKWIGICGPESLKMVNITFSPNKDKKIFDEFRLLKEDRMKKNVETSRKIYFEYGEEEEEEEDIETASEEEQNEENSDNGEETEIERELANYTFGELQEALADGSRCIA